MYLYTYVGIDGGTIATIELKIIHTWAGYIYQHHHTYRCTSVDRVQHYKIDT